MTLEDSLKDIWNNKLISIKEKKLRSNNLCVKGKELLNILDNNNLFWIEWYKHLDKEIASFYIDLRIVDIKENGLWYEVIFDVGQDIILKESPDHIQRIRGERFFAKLKNTNNKYYIYTLKEIVNNKLEGIERYSISKVEYLYKRYIEGIGTNSQLKRTRKSYKPIDAISYAYRFNRLKNRYYPYIMGNNTTNYISQCLSSGGINQKKGIWYCRPKSSKISFNSNDYYMSESWYDFDVFFDFICQNQIGIEVKKRSSLLIGDVVQSYSNRYDECQHSMIVSRIFKDELYITSQYKNKSYMDYPLYLLFPLRKFNRYRYIAID